MNAFDEASKVADRAIDLYLHPFIRARAKEGHFVTTDKGRLSQELQKKYGDLFFNAPDDRLYAVEFKAEQRHTGNLFIETWSNRHRYTRGWLDHLDTDYLLYFFEDRCWLYSMEFPKLKAWAFGNGENDGLVYQYPEKKQRAYNQLNDTWGRIVPVEVLMSHIGAKRWDLSDFTENTEGQARLF